MDSKLWNESWSFTWAGTVQLLYYWFYWDKQKGCGKWSFVFPSQCCVDRWLEVGCGLVALVTSLLLRRLLPSPVATFTAPTFQNFNWLRVWEMLNLEKENWRTHRKIPHSEKRTNRFNPPDQSPTWNTLVGGKCSHHWTIPGPLFQFDSKFLGLGDIPKLPYL